LVLLGLVTLPRFEKNRLIQPNQSSVQSEAFISNPVASE